MDFHANHFQLFGLPENYRLDMTRLDEAYRKLQNEVHPDRFASSGESEKRLSMQWATRVNEAYQALKTPLSRATYLLHLRGREVFSAMHTAFPPAFLMRQMEWREAIADARQARNASALDKLWRELRNEARDLEIRLAAELDDAKDDEAAATSTRELKFMLKLIEEVGDAQEELDAA
jgi:molecular chaperone HscB